MTRQQPPMRVALVVPHMFMHRDILPKVIFSPGQLALSLADQLLRLDVDVTLFSPGPVDTAAKNIVADLSLFQAELDRRGDTYLDLLRKHSVTFVTLARQVQAELIAKAYKMANDGEFDIVHVYTNEEELALSFAELCNKPVVFTHHDPFNFLIRYKSSMPKYASRNWLALSEAQKRSSPTDTNWIATIYHGIDDPELYPIAHPTSDYFAYSGRIVSPKGVHLAIGAVKEFNKQTGQNVKLKIAGKHYADTNNDSYWGEKIEPELGEMIEYVGFIDTSDDKRSFYGNARALIVPSLFDEPFGMVSIEALACGTPVVAVGSGALPEIIKEEATGFVVDKGNEPIDEVKIIQHLATKLGQVDEIDRQLCRKDFEDRFTGQRMAADHKRAYERLLKRS